MNKTALIPENIILENHRVLLRTIEPGDFQLLMPFAMNEPETWQYSLVSAAGDDGMRQYIANAIADYNRNYALPFVVFDKSKNAWAGSTRFYDMQPQNSSLLLGYTWYGKAFRGTGLNLHCKFLMLEYAFETLGVERVEFRASSENARSLAAMKGIGCVEEGFLRSHLTNGLGGRRNTVILSILKTEWEQTIRTLLKQKTKNLSPK